MREEAASVVLRVRDEGEGIAPEFLPLIFEPFRQRETAAVRRRGGLGLGLFIAQQIVSLHGGTIRVESAGLGRGSTFTVTLPRADARFESGVGSSAASASARPERMPQREAPLAGLRILIVDDDASMRAALHAVLAQHGARVTAADSAEAGRTALAWARPHMLISDLAMPLEDGHTFIRRLRTSEAAFPNRRPLPALALTAEATDVQRLRALEAGFDLCLTKPIEADRLIQLVGELSGRRSAAGDPRITD